MPSSSAAAFTAAGGLNMPRGVGADPNIGPSRRNGQRSNPRQCLPIVDWFSGGIEIHEAGSTPLPPNSRRAIGDVAQRLVRRGVDRLRQGTTQARQFCRAIRCRRCHGNGNTSGMGSPSMYHHERTKNTTNTRALRLGGSRKEIARTSTRTSRTRVWGAVSITPLSSGGDVMRVVVVGRLEAILERLRLRARARLMSAEERWLSSAVRRRTSCLNRDRDAARACR